MRLTQKEIIAIKESFTKVFQKGEIYLFGSRLDDKAKGGDIDLFIRGCEKEKIKEKKIKFLVELKKQIGDQKIDVVIAKDDGNPIEQEALQKGIKL